MAGISLNAPGSNVLLGKYTGSRPQIQLGQGLTSHFRLLVNEQCWYAFVQLPALLPFLPATMDSYHYRTQISSLFCKSTFGCGLSQQEK